MTKAEVKPYTPFQMDRLIQFERASTFVAVIGKEEIDLERGKIFVLFDISSDRSLIVDKQVGKMIVGATMGMFNELLNMDLGEEVESIMNEKGNL